MIITRGTVEGYIERTRINLEIIKAPYSKYQEGHVITQLVNSLLGIIVYPWEWDGIGHLKDKKMEVLKLDGWPSKILTLKKIDEPDTIGKFIRHMRNAIAHGRITFSSDSRKLSEVSLTFEDRKPKSNQTYWQVTFNGQQLYQLCENLMNLIENKVD